MKVGMIENKLTLSITVSLFFQNESSRTGLEKYYLWVCRSDASSNLAHLNETPNYLDFFCGWNNLWFGKMKQNEGSVQRGMNEAWFSLHF